MSRTFQKYEFHHAVCYSTFAQCWGRKMIMGGAWGSHTPSTAHEDGRPTRPDVACYSPSLTTGAVSSPEDGNDHVRQGQRADDAPQGNLRGLLAATDDCEHGDHHDDQQLHADLRHVEFLVH